MSAVFIAPFPVPRIEPALSRQCLWLDCHLPESRILPYLSVCLLSRVRLFGTPMDCSSPGSPVHGNIPARMLAWFAVSSPGDLPNPGIKPTCPVAPALANEFFITEAFGKPALSL